MEIIGRIDPRHTSVTEAGSTDRVKIERNASGIILARILEAGKNKTVAAESRGQDK